MKRSLIIALCIGFALAGLAVLAAAGLHVESKNTTVDGFSVNTNPPPGNDPCLPFRYRSPVFMVDKLNGPSDQATALYPFIATSVNQFAAVAPTEVYDAATIVRDAVSTWPTDHTGTYSLQTLTATNTIDAWVSTNCDLTQRTP